MQQNSIAARIDVHYHVSNSEVEPMKTMTPSTEQRDQMNAGAQRGESATGPSKLLVRRADAMPATPMQMEGVKDVSMRMMVGRADGAPNFAMRHYTVEPGGNTPRHSHNYEHEVYILAGEARVEYDDTFTTVHAGDVLFIEPNRVHQFVCTGGTPLQFLCLVPVTFDCGKPTPGS